MADDRLRIPDDELTWRFSRSSGPGGQHVNTSDTRVEVTWDLRRSTVLSEAQRALAEERLRTRLVDGTLTLASSQYRSQHRNREAVRVRLEQLVAAAVVPPRPRRATRPTRASQRRRVDAKKRRGDVKRTRRRPGPGDTG
ncbi:alternative ribosome rescue aminoacyl-tRNA hydrolase ArfB [Aeromicrobium sp. CnD17-E]|uniref:alternative ribosome rescue aminoacyl-tRNA hydrolase ArfB n=1 Tax=Aeromicrobium sp. CnD17-E TaxID=2954487 RepID=UPI0020984A32|nr:alternative ribosome rescue aminoacyl-tRNA hydrolase ArfB [Aeromicrobium sp. CnD17-E]MCO7240530.1 aminoacyl-tRNA hydrolase [Aeromicrobium sp. CnD17-E]